MLLAGGIGGYLVPMLSQKLIEYKGKQKNKEMPDQPMYLSLLCKVICAVVSAAGLGVCGYLQQNWILLVLTALIWILGMLMFLVDFRIRIIANETVLALLILAVAFRITIAGIKGIPNSLLSMVIIIAVWMLLGKIMGLWKVGAGDVKLCGVIGFLFGFPDLTIPIMIMAVSLLIYCGIGLVTKRLSLVSTFAMGPFLTSGMLLGMPYMYYLMTGGIPLLELISKL